MADNLIAVVRDEDRVLLGFEKPENLEVAERLARENTAHCYLLMEGGFEDIKDKIRQQVEFQYRWRFEHEDVELGVERVQKLLWEDLYE